VEGLVLAAVPQRGQTGDAFISKRHPRFDDLPNRAVVATGSVRRQAMLLRRRPDLRIAPIRGNVETRLRKLGESDLDAVILAEAGLIRLGLANQITEILDRQWMLPAVGQGALGLECRVDDQESLSLVRQLDHKATHNAVLAERSLLAALGGGCLIPLGVETQVSRNQLSIRAIVLNPTGNQCLEAEAKGNLADAVEIGEEAAKKLIALGAKQLLQSKDK
jgi:hydroxymethylbilane synthase